MDCICIRGEEARTRVDYLVVSETREQEGETVSVLYARAIDPGTKRIDYESQFAQGVQQILHVMLNRAARRNNDKVSFPVDRENTIVLSLTAKNLLDTYVPNRLVGFTATPGSAMELVECQRKNKMAFHYIPPYNRSRRTELPPLYAQDKAHFLDLCVGEILGCHQRNSH